MSEVKIKRDSLSEQGWNKWVDVFKQKPIERPIITIGYEKFLNSSEEREGKNEIHF